MSSHYEHVIVIGYGKIAYESLRIICEKRYSYSYSIEYIEHEVYPFNLAKDYAVENRIDYKKMEEQYRLNLYFSSILEQTLIVSAGNNYIFPKELVEKNNIRIINFHNALLPSLPGRNAPSWAIYEGYKRTGITWHYVTTDIDAGDIIVQKECSIGSDVKAYELVSELMELAKDSLHECIDNVLNNRVITTKQVITEKRKMYYSYDIPGDGKFELTDSAEDIYRIVRAMDYGKYPIFPMPTTKYDGKKVVIKRYRKIDSCKVKRKENAIYIDINDEYVLEMFYVEFDEQRKEFDYDRG